ncbi:MAG: hypothetical protein BJ554DRAFT_1301 [Olpidium bornovanus]|uniref:Uncharacterized protein n=1 Tax=Olpidium bornovanus TaxID=278681 RepID=A0A8H8DHB1_9FUNG|nr:MAG: hypothetical protein BJ554DRAFT_1301 [Olpidium bornovanus]
MVDTYTGKRSTYGELVDTQRPAKKPGSFTQALAGCPSSFVKAGWGKRNSAGRTNSSGRSSLFSPAGGGGGQKEFFPSLPRGRGRTSFSLLRRRLTRRRAKCGGELLTRRRAPHAAAAEQLFPPAAADRTTSSVVEAAVAGTLSSPAMAAGTLSSPAMAASRMRQRRRLTRNSSLECGGSEQLFPPAGGGGATLPSRDGGREYGSGGASRGTLLLNAANAAAAAPHAELFSFLPRGSTDSSWAQRLGAPTLLSRGGVSRGVGQSLELRTPDVLLLNRRLGVATRCGVPRREPLSLFLFSVLLCFGVLGRTS